MRFILRTVVVGVAVFAVSYLSGGSLLFVQSVWWGILFALVLGLLNGIVRPIVKVLTLPITMLTLGLFSLLINIGFFYLAAAITPGVRTTGFFQTVIAALIIAIVSGLAGSLTERRG